MLDMVGNLEDRFCRDEAHNLRATLGLLLYRYEPHHEKTNILVFDMVQHKPGCTATEDGNRLEISYLGRRGIVLSVKRKQRR